MNVLPGEPIPPGFEDEVSRIAEIQKAIHSYKGNALIGLEYAVELVENGREREPYYICVLCDKRCDPRTIMQHWTSYGHRLEYLDKHFPTAMRELEPVRNKLEKMKVMVQSLSEAIERHHGRGQLSVCNSDDYRRSKSKLFEDVKGKFHYDERNGPNFVNVIDRSLLQLSAQAKTKTPTELDEISSDSDGGANVAKKSRQPASVSRNASAAKRSPSNGESRDEKRVVHFPTPKELSLQASHIAQERYKWEKYRCMLEIYLKQMEKSYKEYEKNPEKHPQYPEEWKAFWNRRYKELQKEKKVDPNKYDYRPEWALYWSKRRKEIFDTDVEKKKKEIKLKLELPEDAEEILDRLKEKYKVQTNRAANASNGGGADSKTGNKRESNVIDISDDEPAEKSPPSRHSHGRSRPSTRRSRSISPRSRADQKRPRMRSKSRSISPFSDEFEFDSRQMMRGKASHVRGAPPPSLSTFSTRRYPPPVVEMGYREAAAHPSYYKHPLYSTHFRVSKEGMHPQYEGPMHSPPPPQPKQKKELTPEPEEEGPLTVVAVLRLLTALEDILGSLGPKMVDLLGKALALDNVKANSADELLLNDDNCVFFETAKEKLKGLLIAEVIEDPQKVRAVKKAIKNIAAIVHQVTTKGKNADKKEETTAKATNATNDVKVNKTANIKDLPFDRQLVASKLAAELVKQGREDLSTSDMDKLIYFFILMAKLSKNKFEIDEKPLHLRDIATEVGIKVVAPVTPAAPSAPSMPARPRITLPTYDDGDVFDEDAVDADGSNDRLEKSKSDGGNSLESLTDSDLQTLLQNFKHLSTEEQHHLIAHLKKLETTDPTRVEKLRKFVNLNDLVEAVEETSHSSHPASSQRDRNEASNSSVTSNRASTSKHRRDIDDSPLRSVSRDRYHDSDDETNQSQQQQQQQQQRGVNVTNPNKFSLDDEDDDDYNFDDVLKAASSIVDTERQSKATTATTSSNRSGEASTSKSSNAADPPAPGTTKPSTDALTFNRAALNTAPNITLSDTQNLIANLMGNLQQNNASKKAAADAKEASKSAPPQPVQTVQAAVPNLPAQNMPQNNMPYYHQSYNQQQQQYPQQQYQQQQYPLQQPPPPPTQAFGGGNHPMGYNQMGYDQAGFYGYNNAYPGYPQQPPQQWGGSGYNMYGGN